MRLTPGRAFLFMAVNAAAALSALALAEVILQRRADKPWDREFARMRPYYAWSFVGRDGERIGTRRGALKLVLHPLMGFANLPSQKTSHFTINRLGLRGPEIAPKTEGRTRVAVLGGSSAFGTGLARDDEALPPRLGRLLGAEALNAGVVGHLSGQELVHLTTEIVDLQPDLVVAYDGWNDFMQTRSMAADGVLGVNGGDQIEEQISRVGWMNRSPLRARLKAIPTLLFPQVCSRLGARVRQWSKGERQAADADAVAGQYVRNVVKMKWVSEAFGARFLCVLQPQRLPGEAPAGESAQSAALDREYRQFRGRVLPRLLEAGVDVLDLNGEAHSAAFRGHFMDYVHLDGEGTARAAEFVAARIRQANP